MASSGGKRPRPRQTLLPKALSPPRDAIRHKLPVDQAAARYASAREGVGASQGSPRRHHRIGRRWLSCSTPRDHVASGGERNRSAYQLAMPTPGLRISNANGSSCSKRS